MACYEFVEREEFTPECESTAVVNTVFSSDETFFFTLKDLLDEGSSAMIYILVSAPYFTADWCFHQGCLDVQLSEALCSKSLH